MHPKYALFLNYLHCKGFKKKDFKDIKAFV